MFCFSEPITQVNHKLRLENEKSMICLLCVHAEHLNVVLEGCRGVKHS